MAILALITKSEEIRLVVSWGAEFAKARSSPLTVTCWTYSPLAQPEDESTERDSLVAEVRRFVEESGGSGSLSQLATSGKIEIHGIRHPEASTAALNAAHSGDFELIVAAAEDQTGKTGATYATNPLLRHSPCNTVILFGGPERSCKPDRILVGATDSSHDGVAVFLASRIAETCNSHITLARAETGFEKEALEVGHRELQQLIRDAGFEREDSIECHVFHSDDYGEMATVMDAHDLILVGANNQDVRD
jgi:hypothetical protein